MYLDLVLSLSRVANNGNAILEARKDIKGCYNSGMITFSEYESLMDITGRMFKRLADSVPTWG